jgi:hypothetical protein
MRVAIAMGNINDHSWLQNSNLAHIDNSDMDSYLMQIFEVNWAAMD